jgi:hypothetical protein
MTVGTAASVLGFTVAFRAAFRVGAACAGDGVGAAIGPRSSLPADYDCGAVLGRRA